jgi:hypothetical protein
MMSRSKTVQEKIADLYALMAAKAAQKAINSIDLCNRIDGAAGAEFWAEKVAKWLDKSSAQAANWTYSKPRINQ